MSFVHSSSQIRYDLAQPDTWANLPSPASIVWCFPAIPQDLASAFGQVMTNKGCRFLLLGSTSAYPSKADVLTDEGDELSMAVPRAQSEEHVRKTYGAIILRLAGLYGPGRHVLDWIRRGKIKNTDRYVNLIHVEDAAALCLTALHQADPGSSYLVSDGMPRRWSDICRFAHARWNISIPEPTRSKDSGKRVSPQKILREFNYTLKYPHLFDALDQIETDQTTTRDPFCAPIA